ncbi:hypothetical protein DPEC_G00348990 [Dallia pectoralis]|uniref:Uncharacterized protein n=1 Tax=Dallia pectoralis TaxID=75939 RepID=A0ACC2F1M4_DALPE|nr:hypothetical protein DPEC_G00348990 [Dallia pectoralis]
MREGTFFNDDFHVGWRGVDTKQAVALRWQNHTPTNMTSSVADFSVEKMTFKRVVVFLAQPSEQSAIQGMGSDFNKRLDCNTERFVESWIFTSGHKMAVHSTMDRQHMRDLLLHQSSEAPVPANHRGAL